MQKNLLKLFKMGVSIAYKAIIKPVEGTILTVAREAAEAGLKAAENTTSVRRSNGSYNMLKPKRH